MATLPFDTYKSVRTLKDAGFPEPQAEVISTAFQNAYAETDLVAKRDFKELEYALKRDLKEIESDVKRDMVELEQRLIIKLGGMMMAGIAIVATQVKPL
jgi:hypothetical protein